MKAKRRLLFVVSTLALVLVGLVVLVSRRHEQLYKLTVLPSLGGTIIQPTAINDHGQIVGTAEGPGGKFHVFLWDPATDLKDLGPGVGNDINNAAQIAGTTRDPNGNQQAFFWDPNDGKSMIGTFGGAESVALSLNNAGQVVGFSDSAEGRPQAFIWDKTNGMRSLSQGWARSGNATAINDARQVMGFVVTGASPPRRALCFWDSTDTVAEPKPPLQSPIDYPGGSDLNNEGYVLGKTYHWDKGEQWTFFWTKERGIEYQFPLEHSVGSLRFNDANQVLYGEKHISSLQRFSRKYFPPHTHYCLRDPKRGKIILDNQVPSDIGNLLRVADINNRGSIVGVIRSKTLGHKLPVLLEPIPERWAK